jgi:hypothetical protein
MHQPKNLLIFGVHGSSPWRVINSSITCESSSEPVVAFATNLPPTAQASEEKTQGVSPLSAAHSSARPSRASARGCNLSPLTDTTPVIDSPPHGAAFAAQPLHLVRDRGVREYSLRLLGLDTQGYACDETDRHKNQLCSCRATRKGTVFNEKDAGSPWVPGRRYRGPGRRIGGAAGQPRSALEQDATRDRPHAGRTAGNDSPDAQLCDHARRYLRRGKRHRQGTQLLRDRADRGFTIGVAGRSRGYGRARSPGHALSAVPGDP